MTSVLILTDPTDLHAHAVAEALRRKGARPVLYYSTDFPTRATETLAIEGGRPVHKIRGPGIELDGGEIEVVWNRRPSLVLDHADLDDADREFALGSAEKLRAGFTDTLARRAFWVNPQRSAERTSKLRQHIFALEVGLDTPDTLYTNDPSEIRGFLRRQGGKIVFKPFRSAGWRDDRTVYTTYTSVLDEAGLAQVDDDLIRAAPGIYQALVPKAHELRVTFIGERAFTAKLRSQETQGGKVDWRRSQDELAMEPCGLPDDIRARCLALMAKLEIVFGCFDFVVTPDGRHVFLEVNQMGQWLFVERLAGIPLLDAFTELLIQKTPGYDWRPGAARVHYQDLEPLAVEAGKQARETHIVEPMRSWYEG